MVVGVKLSNVNTPLLFEVGFVSAKDTSLKNLFGIVNPDRVGVATFTVNDREIEAELKNGSVAACVAVIIVVPDFNIVTIRPEIDATVGSLLVNVNAPTLFVETGIGNSNVDTEPKVRGGTSNAVNTGVVAIYT
jgi:hypothetical protein